MTRLHLDFETRSAADLTIVGAHAYAMHPSTEVVCLGFAFDDEPIQTLSAAQVRGKQFPLGRLAEAVVTAHNAPFEMVIWEHVMSAKYGYPSLRDLTKWDCTMARALMCGLPAKLEDLAKALELPCQKDLEGRQAMLRLTKSLSETPEDYAKLYRYCAADVAVERSAHGVLPMLVPHERAIWELDCKINQRGVAVDVALARQASQLAGALTDKLNARLRALSGGFVDKATQVGRMKRWLCAQGLTEFGIAAGDDDAVSLDKAAMRALIARPDVNRRVREVISVRMQVGKSSTSKYVKTAETVCLDHRVRGVVQYHAAHTGRWGGRLIQPQNYPKGWETNGEAEQKKAVETIMTGDAELLEIMYGDQAMATLSNTLRGTIVAGTGETYLLAADYSSIELCVEMWLANDVETLALLRAGGKPYVDMARALYSNPAITKATHPKEYDLAKRVVLGAGYGMGAEKFQTTCKIQADLDISDELAERAIRVYREKYHSVVRLWADIETAAISAVQNPGQMYGSCGGKALWGMSKDRRFLVCKLPSGRYLWYWKPITRMGVTPWGTPKEELCYWGKHPKTKQWVLLKTYGGALTENVTQAVARDVLAAGMISAEAAGYPIILSVHDELVAERRKGEGSLKEFIEIICATPKWAAGLPVTAEGFTAIRYRK